MKQQMRRNGQRLYNTWGLDRKSLFISHHHKVNKVWPFTILRSLLFHVMWTFIKLRGFGEPIRNSFPQQQLPLTGDRGLLFIFWAILRLVWSPRLFLDMKYRSIITRLWSLLFMMNFKWWRGFTDSAPNTLVYTHKHIKRMCLSLLITCEFLIILFVMKATLTVKNKTKNIELISKYLGAVPCKYMTPQQAPPSVRIWMRIWSLLDLTWITWISRHCVSSVNMWHYPSLT